MLAQNFLSAEALRITEEQHAALIKTLGFFERGEVPSEQFFMGGWVCVTAVCIGGWAERLAGHPVGSPGFLGEDYGSLSHLFFPRGAALETRDPAKGAHALRNYLTTGSAQWDEVMAS